jgi:hypothetical protein
MKPYSEAAGVANSFLSSALDGCDLLAVRSGYFISGKVPQALIEVGGWVGSTSVLDCGFSKTNTVGYATTNSFCK